MVIGMIRTSRKVVHREVNRLPRTNTVATTSESESTSCCCCVRFVVIFDESG
jgi:hypothetical protein